MRDLVIRQRESARRHRVEQLATVLFADHQQARIAQGPVDVNGTIDRGDAVFGEDHDGPAGRARRVGKIARNRVDIGQRLPNRRMIPVRTEALQVIVKMRKIGERQRRIVLGHDQLGGFRNPARRGDRGGRPPELEQGKRAETFGQPLAQFSGHGVAIGKLAAVGLVDRSRRRAPIVVGRHIVPPEHVGAGEAAVARLAGLPDLLAADQPVGLTPEQDFHLVAEQPSISDNAVILR